MTMVMPDDLFACPHCAEEFLDGFRRSRWGGDFTDGFCGSPLGSDPFTPFLCRSCGGVLWINELDRIRATNDNDHGRFQRPRVPDFYEYLEIAKSLTDTPRLEIYVRQLAKWLANDDYRFDGEAASGGRCRPNLDALLQLLDETDPKDRVEKADVLRTMDRFDEAQILLGDLEWLKDERPGQISSQEGQIEQTLRHAASTTVFSHGQSGLFARADAILILAKKEISGVFEISQVLEMRDPTYKKALHLTFRPDWQGQNIWIQFVDDKSGISYKFPHDEFIRELDKRNPKFLSRAWKKEKFTLKRLPKWGRRSWFRSWLDNYRV